MRLPTRLTVIGVAILGATLLVVAISTYQVVRVAGRQAVDRDLRAGLEAVNSSFRQQLGDGSGPISANDLRRATRHYLALDSARSTLTLVRLGSETYSSSGGPESLAELYDEGELPGGNPGTLRTVATDEGRVRILNSPIIVGGDLAGYAIVAGSLAAVDENAAELVIGIGVSGGLGLVLGGAVLAVATRRAVRPITTLADAARRTGDDELSEHVPEPARLDEVGILAREFNRMLDRIGASAEQRRHLISAISHELRTPLAIARGHLELFEALDSRKPTADAAIRLSAVLRGELERLERTADDLDSIADGDAGGGVLLGPVFVPDVLDDLRERLAGVGLQNVQLKDPPAVVVDADQHRLAQALFNLVSNAVTHTPAGTQVSVEATVLDDVLDIVVADNGPGIDEAVRDRIFEPFVTTRSDGSGRGAGLGLAVVKHLIEAQNGTITMDTGERGTKATVRLQITP